MNNREDLIREIETKLNRPIKTDLESLTVLSEFLFNTYQDILGERVDRLIKIERERAMLGIQ